MNIFIIDIEVLKNCFIVVARSYNDKKTYLFEISDRKNDLENLFAFLKDKKKIFVGYNINEYDSLVLFYLMQNAEQLHFAPKSMRNMMLYETSKKIIDRKSANSKVFISELKKLKYFSTIDLMTLIFPPKKQCSLKELQVTLRHKNVIEYEHDWDAPIEYPEIDNLIHYCVNDVLSTEKVFKACLPALSLRKFIKQNYNVECYSLDPVKTGVKYLASKYCEMHNLNLGNFLYSQRPIYNIYVKDILYSDHSFKTKECNDALEFFKNNESPIVPKDKNTYINYRLNLGKTFYNIGCGGIHSINTSSIIECKNDEIYAQSDVVSYYPSHILNKEIVPPFLDKTFLDIYRVPYELKKTSKLENDSKKELFAKTVLNSYFGQLLNENGCFFCPKSFFTITINGQFMILKLIEDLYLNGFDVVCANSDSIEVIMKKDKLELYKSICKNWEDNTKFDLEHSLVKKVIRKSCNDYIMIFENGEIKQKGETFKTEIELGKGFYQPIVKKAIVEYFVNGTKPEDTLKNCNDILDFCMYEKSGKDFTIMHGDEVVQRTNRFYCSNKGKFLHKTRTYYNHKLLKQVTDDINIKNERVVILNNYDSKKKIEEYDINYKYYLTQIYTSIYELLNSTNTLF